MNNNHLMKDNYYKNDGIPNPSSMSDKDKINSNSNYDEEQKDEFNDDINTDRPMISR